ncbi:MAG TPA: DUF3618 domain-containing protein [Anaerolineae bacterium]
MRRSQNVNDPAVIEARIEETRAEMTHTIDQIEEKLSPQRIKQQVQETVREETIGRVEKMADTATQKAKSLRSDIVETIKQNPVPAALAGFGLAWLFMAGNKESQAERYYRYDTRVYPYPQEGQRPQGVSERVSDRVSEVERKASETAHRVRDEARHTAQEVRDRAEQLTHEAQQQTEELRQEAEYQVRRARHGFQQMLEENPLAVGAAAVAIGAAIGMAIPSTRQEDELMGETRDRLVDRAETTAQQTMEKVKTVAEKATTAAEEEAKREAERQDLPKPGGQPLRENQ